MNDLKRRLGTDAGRWSGGVVVLCATMLFSACGNGAAATAEPPASAQVARVGASAPAFRARDQAGAVHTLAQERGKVVVLYFYPRDATPGCTREACAFRDAWARFGEVGATVLGVSTDSVESHRAFAAEHQLPFPLLSDGDGTIADAYGVSRHLGMASRVTFLIDREGVVRRRFDDVDPGVHADEVLAAIRALH